MFDCCCVSYIAVACPLGSTHVYKVSYRIVTCNTFPYFHHFIYHAVALTSKVQLVTT